MQNNIRRHWDIHIAPGGSLDVLLTVSFALVVTVFSAPIGGFTGKKDIFIYFDFGFFSGGGAESRNKFILSSSCFTFVHSSFALFISPLRSPAGNFRQIFDICFQRILVNISHGFPSSYNNYKINTCGKRNLT